MAKVGRNFRSGPLRSHILAAARYGLNSSLGDMFVPAHLLYVIRRERDRDRYLILRHSRVDGSIWGRVRSYDTHDEAVRAWRAACAAASSGDVVIIDPEGRLLARHTARPLKRVYSLRGGWTFK